MSELFASHAGAYKTATDLYASHGGEWVQVPLGSTEPPSTGWTRPADWLPNDIPAGTQQVNLLSFFGANPAVEANRVTAVVATGAYTVDWGDGTAPQNFGSGVTAKHMYNPVDLAGTETSDGWLQALVKITPQAGVNLVSVEPVHVYYYPGYNYHAKPVKEVVVGSSICTLVKIGDGGQYNTSTERVVFKEAYKPDSLYYHFARCITLHEIVGEIITSGKQNDRAFDACFMLEKAPKMTFTATSNIVLTAMFYEGYALKEAPTMVFVPGTVSSMSLTFYKCHNMRRLPSGFTTQGVISMDNMFTQCFTLERLVGVDFSSPTTLNGTFNNLYQLTELTFAPGKAPKASFDISYSAIDAAGLNAIYASLPVVTGKTVTVSAIPGTLGDDPTIATAKGWTVTGS